MKSDFTLLNQNTISKLNKELDVLKNSQIQEYQDKLKIYRMVTGIVADLLADFDLKPHDIATGDKQLLSDEEYNKFYRNWMKGYGYLAMLAPQSVMDAYDKLSDHLIQIAAGDVSSKWVEIRKLVFGVINEIRKDVGINKREIKYKGIL